jgi:pimeloyl-ACP methyl ester carboxylesterase
VSLDELGAVRGHFASWPQRARRLRDVVRQHRRLRRGQLLVSASEITGAYGGVMPMLERGDVRLRYEVRGDGPAILFLAPGGLRASRIETWSAAPWNPIDALAERYTTVAMDQRNTGTSFGPISAGDGWATYAADQLAVMDELGIERFAVIGMCIGGAFITELLAEAPDRIAAAVAMQPIGLDGNRDEFRAMFDQWREMIGDEHPEAGDADWDGCWTHLFGGDQLMWSVADAQLSTFETPILVLQGNDVYHPRKASVELAALAPAATLVERWKDPADQPAARRAVDDFLAAHLR